MHHSSQALARLFFPSVLLLVVWLFPFPPAMAGEHVLEGEASWYGLSAHGKPTATGERFNRAAPTAAHRTLPFGTIVRVHNLANNHRTLVRINDRGPFLPLRILDVSLRAAHILRMQEAGIAPVALEIVSDNLGRPLNPRNSFFLSLAGAQTPQEAHDISAQLHENIKLPIRAFFAAEEPHALFSLCLGPYTTFREAEAVFLSLQPAPLSIIEAPTFPPLPPFPLPRFPRRAGSSDPHGPRPPLRSGYGL